MKILFCAIVIYLLYKLFFEFIFPVAKATNKMRDKIQEMQNELNRQSQTNSTINNQQQPNNAKPAEGEYIDFEEVK
jgi:CBS domain containing-hemolysin-like protein